MLWLVAGVVAPSLREDPLLQADHRADQVQDPFVENVAVVLDQVLIDTEHPVGGDVECVFVSPDDPVPIPPVGVVDLLDAVEVFVVLWCRNLHKLFVSIFVEPTSPTRGRTVGAPSTTRWPAARSAEVYCCAARFQANSHRRIRFRSRRVHD